MLRVFLSTVSLVGALALAHPAFADPADVAASGHAQATAAVTEQGEPAAAPAGSWSSDATVPAARIVPARNVAPAGFGWS